MSDDGYGGYNDRDYDSDYDSDGETHYTDPDEDEEDEELENQEIEEDELVIDDDLEEDGEDGEDGEKDANFTKVSDWNTFQYLTEWEVARILTNRTQQIEGSEPIFVEPIPDEKPFQTAIRELIDGKIPLLIERIDIASGKTLYTINPNEINPRTGQRWFIRENFRMNMF